jgi:hypothetical protein
MAFIAWQLVGMSADPDIELPDVVPGAHVLWLEARSYTLDQTGIHQRRVETGTMSVRDHQTLRQEVSATAAANGHAIQLEFEHMRSRVRPELLEQRP